MIIEKIQEHYEKKAKEPKRSCWQENGRTFIRASATSECLRALWYDLNGYERLPSSADLVRASEEGTAFENHMRALLRSLGVDIRDEQKTVSIDAGELVVIGHLDNILYERDEPRAVIDYKKEGHRFGVNLFEKHRPQLSCYLAATGLRLALVITQGKQSGYRPYRFFTATRKKPFKAEQLEEIQYHFSRFYFEELIKQLAVIKYMKPDPLPPEKVEAGAEFYPWNCYFCAFSKQCRSGAVVVKYNGRYKLAKEVSK